MANINYEQMARDLISNISYTNKDFRSIYPELIDLVKKLTNKWDPEITNESDPGLVLLKLLAIIADKNNYNIDKNILEAFPLSVTQYGNARKLYDILGYKMKWYRSATTTITVLNNYDKEISSMKSPSISSTDNKGKLTLFPIFTMLSDDSGEYIYTILQEVPFNKGTITNIPVIEGTNYKYDINGETTITLNNLDADLRLYFKEPYVAQNGVFIRNIDDGEPGWSKRWEKVDNLAASSLGQKIFEFGVLPNSNICYVQFPQDIGNLIENGLEIQYVISSGVNGNINAKEINTCTVDIIGESKADGKDVNLNEYITIANPSAATNGSDPEGLDEAYRGYKKVVGTFNTLVTCKDYEDHIFQMQELDDPVVSNVVVSDRTNDIKSVYAQSESNSGNKKLFVGATYDSEQGEKEFTAFDLSLYTLKAVPNIYDITTYDTTFRLDSTVRDVVEQDLQLQSGTVACMQHDYTDNSENKVGLFLNKFTINANVLTYYKISNEEIKELKENIQQALRLKYNSRELNFGESIAYDELVNTIQSADSRIKLAIVDQPVYTTYYIDYKNNESSLSADDDEVLEIITQMIMRGNTQFLVFDNDFEWKLGQKDAAVINNIKSITTEVTIPKGNLESTDGYELKANENIQAITPSYITKANYSAWMDYEIVNKGTVASDYKLKIEKNVPTKFQDDAGNNISIKLIKKDDDGNETTYNLPVEGIEYFKLNFDIELIGNTPKTGNLQSSKQVETLEQNITELAGLKAYWITNTKEVDSNKVKYNVLNFTNGSHVLDTNEYFIYTDPLETGLVILGSGTEITVKNNITELKVPAVIDISKLNEQGLKATSDVQWYSFSKDDEGKIHEMVIYTLGEGTKVKLNLPEDVVNLSNDLVEATNISYQEKDKSVVNLVGDDWRVRSRLNLNATPSIPQKLGANQTITLLKAADPTHPASITENQSILFNENVQLAGGSNIDTSVLDLEGNIDYTLNCLNYTQENIPNTLITQPTTTPLIYRLTVPAGKRALWPIYVNGSFGEGKGITITPTGGQVKDYSIVDSNTTDLLSINSAGTYYIELIANEIDDEQIPVDLNQISLNITANTSDKFSIQLSDNFYIIDGINDKINSTESDIKSKIEDKLKNTNIKFNYTYIVPDDMKIDNPVLPKSFWDPNHYCNRFVLPMIDFKNSNINIINTNN